MTEVRLQVEGASKRFRATQALDGASLVVGRGELIVLLGPNGASKTTMIRAIAGRVALDRGTVTVAGRTVRPADPRPDIGAVPQELAVYDKLTARENLEAFGALCGVAPRTLASRVDWALEWSDLQDRAREPVAGFSGGMKRRLNIAVGLLHGPQVVLLDEPTVGVDPQSRERIYNMLAGLRAEGVSVVLTTNYLEEVERRCERIVIIDHGSVVATGTLAELLSEARGAGGTLLEDEEAGTLDRLIGSRAGMAGVLWGKWVFLTLLGCAQLTVMFLWGAVVFGLPLADHVAGFVIMTLATAAAAAAFGLVLATLSRTRAQLSGLSTIIILSISAVGGSMFPRFMMSETMQQMGLVTFNAWALDGYLKVFWYGAPIWQLWPQVGVLGGLAAVFMLTARRLARRWETV